MQVSVSFDLGKSVLMAVISFVCVKELSPTAIVYARAMMSIGSHVPWCVYVHACAVFGILIVVFKLLVLLLLLKQMWKHLGMEELLRKRVNLVPIGKW